MIKILSFICVFALASCGIERQDSNVPNKTIATQSLGDLATLNKEKAQIDIMVAFLWPKSLEENNSKVHIKSIIEIGRFLRRVGDSRLEKKSQFKFYQCEEVMTGEITVEPEIEDLCYELSDEIDEMAFTLFSKVNEMQAKVNLIGGEWLKSFHDIDVEKPGFIDLQLGQIYFPAMGTRTENNEEFPIPYAIKNISLSPKGDYYALRAQWESKDRPGNFSVDMSVSVQPYSVIYQGELTHNDHQGNDREGLIYWQILR